MTSDHRVAVRALPGAKQVSEPLHRRKETLKKASNSEESCLYFAVILRFGAYWRFFKDLLNRSDPQTPEGSKPGNLTDVQSAVALANPGDTVAIPSGHFSWNGGRSITKSLILQGAGSNPTFISRTTPMNYTGELVTVQPSSDVPVRVTGISFNASSIGQNYNRLPCVAVWGPQGGRAEIIGLKVQLYSLLREGFEELAGEYHGGITQ